MEEYKMKFSRNRYRLKKYDYSNDGFYFITINTKNNYPYFGKIIDDEVKLSTIGKIVKEEWKNTAIIRKNVFLDEYIIMPNHFHAILIINNHNYCKPHEIIKQCLKGFDNVNVNAFGPNKNNLASIIRAFKSVVRHRCKRENLYFNWHNRYFDQILLSEKSIERVRNYIKDNPKNYYKNVA